MNMVDSPERAGHWAAAISHTLLANLTREKLEELLGGYVEQLLGGGVDAARQVGRSMVENDFISSATLEQTLSHLGEHTPVTPAQLAALAAGYAEGLRDRTLDQQEISRTAAINTMRLAESAVRVSEAKFRAVFHSAAFGIIVSGLKGDIIDVNEALLTMLGYSAGDLGRMSGRDFVHPEDRAGLRELARQLIASDFDNLRVEKRMVRSDGETIQTHMAISLVREAEGAPPYFVTMVENMNEMRALQSQLVRQSLNDMQTGLPNRTQFLGWLEGAVGTKMHVARHLRAVFTEEIAKVARIGEDEFGVLIRNPRGVLAVVALVDDFTARLEEAIWIDGHGIGVTASTGIVARAARGGDAADLLRAADVTVGWAKRDGKAQWALYDRERDERDRERYALAASIPGALEEGQFRIAYQPVRSLTDGSVLALEAKIAWDHPVRGVLCPDAFLSQSSDNGMIVRLVRWALAQACDQAGEWYAALGSRTPVLSIDLPPRLCQEPELVAEVSRVLDRARLPASRLRFELHEQVPVLLTDEHLEELTILAERGVELVLDQLTGGNAGVERLRMLPWSGVKFAPAVVHGFDTGANRVDETASAALLEWASVLRLPMYAEDVRSEAEATRLAALGVTGAQGSHFGPALSAAEVAALLLI
jgi:PAS domain S-box-containing protein